MKFMNTMNLNAAGVMELSAVELQEIDGGLLKEIGSAIIDVINNWDAYVAAFKKGFREGNNYIK
jgi:hypothetical protein